MHTVYLIHFDQPVGVPGVHMAQHYLGCTSIYRTRMMLHHRGAGAALLRHLGNLGIHWKVVDRWEFKDQQTAWAWERQLKRRHKSSEFCPICRATAHKAKFRTLPSTV